ncbi:MAG: ABC transporter permease, partial [Chitinophagaceae bacterium]
MTGTQTPAVFRNQKDIVFADTSFFNLFQYKWLAGSPESALKDPFQVVLTEDRAKTYFGSLALEDMLGREVVYDDSIKTIVAGIIKGFDKPTDFTFQEFISRSTLRNSGLKNHFQWDDWNSFNTNSQLLVKLEKGKQPTQVLVQLAQLRDKHRQRDPEQSSKDDTKHSLQPLADMHFNATYDIFENRLAHRPTLYGLLAVASFLLLLGCINFINLTTAQASRRAKEIGIRKTIGSGKRQLIIQFLSETFLLTFLATALSVIITPWLLNIFGDFIPRGISFSSLNQVHVYVFLLLLTLLVTFLSGLYPAMVLTKFKPAAVLKNQSANGTSQTRRAWFRKTLTVTQFVIAQFLIIATLVVSKQVHYSLTKDLGFKKEAIVFFNTRWNFFSTETDNRRFALMEKLKSIPGIEQISLSGS